MKVGTGPGQASPKLRRLIVNRALRMGFREDELDDVLQEVSIALLDFRFDASKSNGACETTALTALVAKQLKFICRTQGRYRARLERYSHLRHRLTADDSADLALDVQGALAGLTRQERRVCDGLSRGRTLDATAKEMKVSWHTVERMVQRIREHFSKLGLDPWLEVGPNARAARCKESQS